MPYANRVIRATIFGTMYGGAEEWSTGFYLGVPGVDSGMPSEAAAQEIGTAWNAFFENVGSGISWAWKTAGVKLALKGTDGKTVPDNVATYYYSDQPVGAKPDNGFPPQVAVVCTLLAGTGKGLAGKGRMYIPGVSHSVQQGGRMHTDSAASVSLNLKTFMDAVNAAPSVEGILINASQGRLTAGGSGPISRVVNELRVGTVYDTQRRRRNGLVEEYSSRTLV